MRLRWLLGFTLHATQYLRSPVSLSQTSALQVVTTDEHAVALQLTFH